ncbi:DNA repair protein rad16, partial [Spiromyces aspiralis]
MTREQQSPLTPPSLPTKRSRGRPRKDAHTPSDLSEQALPPTPQSLQRPPSISSTATSDKDTPESPQVEGAGRRRRSSRLAPKKGLASPAASLSEASASAKPMVTVDSSSESVVEIIVPHVTFNGLKSIDTTGNDGTLSRKHTRAAQDSDAARPAKRKVVRSPTASSGLSWTVSSDDSDSDFTEPLLRSPGINGRRRSLRRSVKASLLAQSSDESMPFTGATSPVKPESKQGTGIGERTTQGEAASVSFDDDNDEDYREDGDDDDDDDDGSQLDQEDDSISHETRAGPTSDTESEEVTEYIPRSRQQTRRAPKKRRGGKNAVKSLEEYIKNGEMPPKRPKSMNFHQWTTYCLHYYHPELKTVWEDLEQQIAQKCQKQLTPCAEQPRGLKLSLLPFQREGLAWLREQEAGRLSGGILADEMGMGKTIQMISLMLSEPRVKPTLVVAPTVALMQWKSELTTHTSDLSVLVYYGANRTQEDQTLLDHDVVITTYSVLESVFRRSKYGVR